MKPHSKKLRIGRVSLHDQLYMVTTTVHRRERLFLPLERGALMARLIGDPSSWNDCDLQAWVIMPDHVHVLLKLASGDLSNAVGSFKGRSSLLFNRTVNRRGALWQPGFHDYAVRKDQLVTGIIKYMAANPLRAGLVGALADWPLMGGALLEQWLDQFGKVGPGPSRTPVR